MTRALRHDRHDMTGSARHPILNPGLPSPSCRVGLGTGLMVSGSPKVAVWPGYVAVNVWGFAFAPRVVIPWLTLLAFQVLENP
jgi:hypothetical protein